MYDVIVVGAGAAGSSTAMLLSGKGHRVLLLERASLPSDSPGAHHLTSAGVQTLERWSLLERLLATGCPKDDRTIFATPGTMFDLWGQTCSPRRCVLETLLVEAAVEAGADVRENFTVTDLIWREDRVTGIVGHGSDGHSVVEHARLVVGADGRHSVVAHIVGAARYVERPATGCCFSACWRDLPGPVAEFHLDHRRAVAVLSTNDGLVCVSAARPIADWVRFKRTPEALFVEQLEGFPTLAERLRGATRVSRFHGTADLEGCFRRPFGPGWALVGDAGHHRDPLLGGGITEALVQAELLAAALPDGLADDVPLERALTSYQRRRDDWARERYELTCEVAAYDWTTDELPGLLGRLAVVSAREVERLRVW